MHRVGVLLAALILALFTAPPAVAIEPPTIDPAAMPPDETGPDLPMEQRRVCSAPTTFPNSNFADKPWPSDYLRISEAQKFATGAGVTVAVIDTGVNGSPRVPAEPGGDFVDKAGNGMSDWINTVSRGHVQRGVQGRFTQANHGKPNMLRKMARGDWIVFYSPRTDYPDGDPLQAFTAIGQVADDEPYQVEMTPEFQPWRRNVDFLACNETPIRPLIDQLEFIEDKARWGYKFRFGVFRIDDHDLEVIRSAMTGSG